MTSPSTRYLQRLAALACVSITLSIGAAEADEEKADNNEDARPSQKEQSPKDKDKGPDIFRPSEEISEDFSVAFPVDI